jgi:hypothetical protein
MGYEKINGRLLAVPLNGLLDASLLFLISGDILEDFRDYQFPGQRPNQASRDDNHESTEHFVWNSTFGP